MKSFALIDNDKSKGGRAFRKHGSLFKYLIVSEPSCYVVEMGCITIPTLTLQKCLFSDTAA